MQSGMASLLMFFCMLFMIFHESDSQISYRVRLLRVYPEVFRFKTGNSVVYYKQLGRGKVSVSFNGTAIEKDCLKIRFIYGQEMSIDGFWKKCPLPGYHGVFIVKALNVHEKRYENYDSIEF